MALWSGIGAAAVGVGLNLWALERREATKQASQRQTVDANRTIARLNTGAAISYALAGMALGTWLALELWPSSENGSLTLAPVVTQRRVGLALELTK